MLFYISYFALLVVLLSLVLFSNSQQRRLLSMIFILLNFALCLVFLHFEYTAFIIIIIYIGAISVLFLFVIMLVNLVKNPNQKKDFAAMFCFFMFFFVFFLYGLFSYFQLDSEIFFTSHALKTTCDFKLLTNFVYYDNILYENLSSVFFSQHFISSYLSNVEVEQLGFVLWTNFGCLIVLSAVILVISIVGSVAVLKSMVSSNVLKKQILSVHARQNLIN